MPIISGEIMKIIVKGETQKKKKRKKKKKKRETEAIAKGES